MFEDLLSCKCQNNVLSKRHSKHKRNDLRPISAILISANPSLCLTKTNHLCTICQKELHRSAAAALLEDTVGPSTYETIESENVHTSSPEMESLSKAAGDTESEWQEDEEGGSQSSYEAAMESQQSDESEIIIQLKERSIHY